MCPFFPFGIEDGMWDVIVLIPGHCLSIYFSYPLESIEGQGYCLTDKIVPVSC